MYYYNYDSIENEEMGGCSAPNCTNSWRKGFRMFMFPKDPMRRRQWVMNCSRDGVIQLNHACLCEAHFEPDQFESRRIDGWRKLKPSAVPTLFDLSEPKKASIRRKSPSRQSKVLKIASDHTYSEDMSEREDGGECPQPWKFGFSYLQVEQQPPVQSEEPKRPEIIVLKPADVQDDHILPDAVSLLEYQKDVVSAMQTVGNEHQSAIGDESFRNPPLGNCETPETISHSSSSTVEPNIICVRRDPNIFPRAVEDIAMFHHMADFIRENRPNHTTFTVANVLMSACVKFCVPIQLLSHVYPGEHIIGQRVVYSCMVKIKDVLISEDVSRDEDEACSRAVNMAYDTILGNSLHMEVNEFGIMCLKSIRRKSYQILPTVPLKHPPKEPWKWRKKKRAMKANSVNGAPSGKKKKKNKQSKLLAKATLKNAKNVPHKKSQNAKLVKSLEQEILDLGNCSEGVPPKGEGKVVYLAENVDFISDAPAPKFIIYDDWEVTNVHCAFTTLNVSAALSNVPVKLQYRVYSAGGPQIQNCEFYIFDQLMCQAIGRSKADARSAAAAGLLQALKKIFYTIKEKRVQSDDFMITPDQFNGCLNADVFSLSEENIGCKLLKSMGWSGGGIGKMGDGITEPIKADATYSHGRGLGFSDDKTSDYHFRMKVDSILSDYVALNPSSDLVFSSEFTDPQRHKIQNKALRYNMKVVSRVVGNSKELVVHRKCSVREIFNVLKNGGSMDKYELVPPDDSPKDL